MKLKILTISVILLIIGFLSLLSFAQNERQQVREFEYPVVTEGRGLNTRGAGSDVQRRLSPELRILLTQFRDGTADDPESRQMSFNEAQLMNVFGIRAETEEPLVSIAVETDGTARRDTLEKAGMRIHLQSENIFYGRGPVLDLGKLETIPGVVRVGAVKAARPPSQPAEPMLRLMRDFPSPGARGGETSAAKPANQFNKGTLSGKGVIIGIVDSGIDWRHPDFIKPDGKTSRILAIWDYFDDSFKTSKGKIGSKPEMLAGDQLAGTVYTNAQINAALEDTGTVNSNDNHGHGTATAGTAAGNGLASDGKYAGVAPNADLLVFKTSDCDRSSQEYIYGIYWMLKQAKKRNKPIVVNISLGHYYSLSNDEVENYLNGNSGKRFPGFIYTVSAGNAGRNNMHAAGRFGPKKEGQIDQASKPVSVNISPEKTGGNSSVLLGLFDSGDEWGIEVVAGINTGWVDKDNKPLRFHFFKYQGKIEYWLPAEMNEPDWFKEFALNVIATSDVGKTKDQLYLKLPPGNFELTGYGATEKVSNGKFDFYAPNIEEVDFGEGTVRTGMVSTPGNAKGVITVGAYNFRPSWLNMEGTVSTTNRLIGEIADYSSPGGRRPDGVVKPDIVAPGSFAISPLSAQAGPGSRACGGNNMGALQGTRYIINDGKYISWEGTSAAAPFTAGVIALMLEKNPRLNTDDVRKILTGTAKKGETVGAVPNPRWGWGMLDPEAALRKTVRRR